VPSLATLGHLHPGNTLGTDTLRITDTQGHTGTFNVGGQQHVRDFGVHLLALASSSLGRSSDGDRWERPRITCHRQHELLGTAGCSVVSGNLT